MVKMKDANRPIVKMFLLCLRYLVPSDIRNDIWIDQASITRALRQSSVDIDFIRVRRGLDKKKGISEGKFWGVVLFRLCRHRFVHLSKSADGKGDFSNLQEKAALLTVLMLIDIPDVCVWLSRDRIRLRLTKNIALANIVRELRWTPLLTSSLSWLAGKPFSRTAEY